MSAAVAARSGSAQVTNGQSVFIFPEYCGADLFMGWHLYERDRNDGSVNDDGGWGWLRRGDLRLQFDIAPLFPELPQPINIRDTFDDIAWHQHFVGAFAARYPVGVRLEKRGREYARPAEVGAIS